MHIAREGKIGHWPVSACLAAGLAAWPAAQAPAIISGFRGEGSSLVVGDVNVAQSGGTFQQNAAVRVLVVGSKTLDLERGDLRDPVALKTLVRTESEGNRTWGEISDLSSLAAPMRFALTEDIGAPKDMTPLDATSTPDLGRMLQPSGTAMTRMRVFTALPEKDDNDYPDDSPEVLLMGAVPGVPISITPILSGSPDMKGPDDDGTPAAGASGDGKLTLGTPTVVPPSEFIKGLTPVSLQFQGNPTPQRICIIGLDLSSDLGIGPGQTVVGYQVDMPQGSSFPLKLEPVGDQVLSPMMTQDGSFSQEEEPFLSFDDTPAANPELSDPPIQPGTDYTANLVPFTEEPNPFVNPPVPPPPPPVPTPGTAVLTVVAAAMARRRRHA